MFGLHSRHVRQDDDFFRGDIGVQQQAPHLLALLRLALGRPTSRHVAILEQAIHRVAQRYGLAEMISTGDVVYHAYSSQHVDSRVFKKRQT